MCYVSTMLRDFDYQVQDDQGQDPKLTHTQFVLNSEKHHLEFLY